MSHRVRLRKIHLVKVQPQLAHVCADLLHRDGALPDGVEGGGVVVIYKVGGVVVSFRATVVLNITNHNPKTSGSPPNLYIPEVHNTPQTHSHTTHRLSHQSPHTHCW